MAEPRRDLPVPLRVEVRRQDGTTSIEYAVNLAPSGACIQVREPIAPGETVHVSFALPPDETPVSVSARVVWCTCEEEREGQRFCEMGVRFEDAGQELREKLHRFATHPADPAR